MLEKQNKYSIRKLTVGAASVLIGASFFAVNGKTVEADTVNDTNNANANKVVQESTGEKAPDNAQDGLLKGTDKIEKNSSVESGTNANTSNAPANQDNPVTKDSQHSGEADVSTGIQLNTNANCANITLQTSAPVKQSVPAIGTMQNQDNTVNNGVKVPETQTLNLKRVRNIKLNAVSLQDNKVQAQNIATNGGFDEATWGKLDVNSWKGQAENGVYQLTDYTGDLAHIIVPNAADFVAAGKDIGGLQVGIDADTTHGWFEKGDPKTIAFSKTGGEKVKAVGQDWTVAFTGYYNASQYEEGKAHSLTKFDGNNLDVSNVTDMKGMFAHNQLTNLTGLTNWDVGNVTKMSYMFAHNQLTDLTGLTNWNVNNVTNMDSMFQDNQLTNLTDLAKWNVGNVTNMNSMFKYNKISDLSPLAKWNVGKVTDMSNMFQGNQLTDLTGLTNWKTDNVTDMSNMFQDNQLTNLTDLAKWNVGNVITMYDMFEGNQLTDLIGLVNWNVGNVINMEEMFKGNQLTNLTDLSKWNVANVLDMSYMFQNNQLTDLTGLINWDVANVKLMQSMFASNQLTDLTSLAKWNVNTVTNIRTMFYGNHITFANFTKWNFDQLYALDSFISQDSNAIILVKDVKDQTKLLNASRTAANKLSFVNVSATDTVSMPTVLVATDKEAARRELLDQINQKVQAYQKAHPNMVITPVTQLDNLVKLVDVANAKFNVAQIITVTVHFFDDIGTNQDNAPKDITLNNQVVGQVLTIDAIKDNPELANYNLVPGRSYTVAVNTPWVVHLTHKTSEHDASCLPATRTICVHMPDGTTQTTVQTIGYKYTVTHDLVTNQDFNGEPIFDKNTTETVVTTVDKNGKSTSQTDKSTVFYTKASDGKYYNFNSFKLPTFPGYKIHMTANSSGIEISYARKHLSAINFVDSTNPGNIVKTYNVSGFTGQTVATDISDNIPENWEIVPSITAPETITYTSNDQEDTPINIKIQHKVVAVSKDNDPTFETDSVRNVTREIYAQLDNGESDYVDSQQISLKRHGTFDLVTKQITWGSYEPVQVPAYTITDLLSEGMTVENPNAAPAFTADGNTKDMVVTFRVKSTTPTGSGVPTDYISATNFAIIPTDSTSLTLPKIADSVQVPQSKNVQKEDDTIQCTVKPHAAVSNQELDSLVKTAALPSVKLNKQNLKELKQIFVNNNPQDLRSVSWKLQDSALSLSTPLYTLSNSSHSIMLPHLIGYKFKLIKRGTGENSVSFAYSKDKNYKYVFNIAFKDNVMYLTVLTPNKAHNKLTVKQVYKVHNQKELADILSLYL